MSRPERASTERARRIALAGFLTTRRKQIPRASVGTPLKFRGHKVGLSREEVAYHSSVSMTWYTWLEQARDIQPSRAVLLAIAETLQLNPQEQQYVLQLAGYACHPRQIDLGPGPKLPESVQRLMDAMNPNPAFAISPTWFLMGWNSAYELMFPRVVTLAPEQRHLLAMVFLEESVRRLMPDWETDAHRFLAEFRTEVGPYLDQPEVKQLVEHLLTVCEEFRTGWQAESLELFSTRSRRFEHPIAGLVQLEHQRLIPNGHPDLEVVLYTPGDRESALQIRSSRPDVSIPTKDRSSQATDFD